MAYSSHASPQASRIGADDARTHSGQPSSSVPGWLWLLFGIVLAGGVAVRLYHYIVNRSLFLDEASIALNILNRSWTGLFAPLDNFQGAPIGFLLVEKTLVQLFGPGERTLRLLPLCASLASLALYPFALARNLGVDGASRVPLGTLSRNSFGIVTLATALLAFANYSVYYAVEVKQYALDLFFAVLLLYSAAPILRGSPAPAQVWRFGSAALVAVLFSHPSVFVIAGFAGAGAVIAMRSADAEGWHPRAALPVILAVIPAALLFGILYLFTMRSLTSDGVLAGFWDFAFMPLPPWSDWGWFGSTAGSIASNPLEMRAAFAWLLIPVGAGVWLAKRRTLALAVAIMLLATLCASALHAYPFAARLLLFLLPFVYFAAADGVSFLAQLPRQAFVSLLLWVVLSAWLLYSVGDMTVRRAATPYAWREHFAPAMQYLQQEIAPGDTVYCSVSACPQFKYYAQTLALPAVELVEGKFSTILLGTSVDEVDTLRDRERVWLVVSRPYGDDREQLLAHMAAQGTKVAEFAAFGVEVWLFDTQP